MRVSQIYSLTQRQDALDFVDVDVELDTPLFIDPRALYVLDNEWAHACIHSIQSFFQRVLDAAVAKDSRTGLALLGELGEPNETHLGLSKGRSRGNAVGSQLAEKFWTELSTSDAVESGLITDLEDTALLIEGVREDRISDVTTNIIRRQLIEYTQTVCSYYEMGVAPSIYCGPEWDSLNGKWERKQHPLPVAGGMALLLVPKSLVRQKLHINPGEYYRHHVLNFLWHEEIQKLDTLSPVARGRGRPPISKGSVEDRYRGMFGASRNEPGVEKRINTWFSKRDPSALENYKEQKKSDKGEPLTNEEIAAVSNVSLQTLRSHLAEVRATPPGGDNASLYHKRVEALLSALFYPDLLHPRREAKIHTDRKRIDISYTNAARNGFFRWAATHYPAANIVVECKNYSREIANPEYDQLAGRFSPSRGKIGLLLYRGYADKAKVRESCKDTAIDDRGWIIALDDDDLEILVEERSAGSSSSFGYLHDLFNQLNHRT